MSVYLKLNAARNDFHKLQLKKTGQNKFAGYSYFELGDFLIPALETFQKNGLCAFVSFGEKLAKMTIVDTEDATSIELTSPMAEANLKGCHPIQNLGAVETYTRRYLWLAALEIVEHDALDSAPPVDKKVTADVKVKLPALAGIGDDLPQDIKTMLGNLALTVTHFVNVKNDPEGALDAIHEVNPIDDEKIYLDRQLPSNVRSALRKLKTTA